MTAVSPIVRPVRRATHTVRIAGVPWPVYKLESVALGALLALILGLITGSAELAVLVAAGAAALRWIVGAVAHRGSTA
ncbi:hypothetical protein A5780_16360 [Nocardia sp. 852002-20019_SCH5090214]|jgi:hypothetical protein|uniref:Uncharacterized protein n=1 Tax=Nocardia nova TaxID=37330 RepID=A0A2S6A843_9NOCA|nr:MULTISPECIES: hypothetical protein [Nocardia]OBF68480.1 hypothetical protein A9X06_33740 [Mycobacterium sp. 852002-51759_SCH5129042]MBF6148216.1 hypothetical protein [Nocardia nova]MBF6274582.1 hypothetical protein [Nocardia nova]MBV7705132.1 hypothetical protein [Nocardia nova]MDN2497923.1 hypothetical protein [Nocardia nova]